MTIEQLTQAIGLLKFFDRSKITADAVKEIGALAGLQVPDELAAKTAQAYTTRGQAGLLPVLPSFLKLVNQARKAPEPAEEVFVCARCGHAALANRPTTN